ncbi:hypothetical protein THAOC_10602, partial [Thalassiosira oceanica]
CIAGATARGDRQEEGKRNEGGQRAEKLAASIELLPKFAMKIEAFLLPAVLIRN